MIKKILGKLLSRGSADKKPASTKTPGEKKATGQSDSHRGQSQKSSNGPKGQGASRKRNEPRGSNPRGEKRGESQQRRSRSGNRADRPARNQDSTKRNQSERAKKEPFQAPPPPVAPEPTDENIFSELGLEGHIAVAVEEMGYIQPTPIQSEAIPMVMEGRDMIASAQTGTGKTAAFGLPILDKLGVHGKTRCLILEPTRELAAQVEEAFKEFGKYTNLRVAVLHGGVGYGHQCDELDKGLDVVVATPGRLLDHLEQGNLHFRDLEFLVLDEVDRMLDMGFLPDVKRIVKQCPEKRQTLFFSATLPPAIEKLMEWVLKDPHVIEIGHRRSPAETVTHAFYPVVHSQKFDLFIRLLDRTDYKSVLIFCRTKLGADMIARRLENLDHSVAVMHSNRSQSERTEALAGFKSGKYGVMVATDIAARGLDVEGITHVINYDVPLHPDDYVHRIGRTGRAESEGDAFTLLTEDEINHAKAIERYIGKTVERFKLEGFDYKYSAVFAEEEAPPKNQFKSRLYRGMRR